MRTVSSILRRGFGCAAVVSVLAFPAVAAERAFELALVKGVAVPASPRFQVTKGDDVVIRFTSDTAGDVHLHGYKQAANVGPGKPGEWRFKAHATGRFRFEWHAAGDTGSHHHGPPLATLDVLPK